MKFDQAWVAENAQCAAGMAWGLEYVRAGAKDLRDALPGFDRADWLLWFLARTGLLERPFEFTFKLLLENLPAEFKGARELVTGKTDAGDDVRKIRVAAATEAFTAAALGKMREAYAFEAAGFEALMAAADADEDRDKALLYAQCVLLSLVGAIAGKKENDSAAELAHVQLCDQLRAAARPRS